MCDELGKKVEMKCVVCDELIVIQVLDIKSPEAKKLCLACEAKGVCGKCSLKLHGVV